MVRDSPPSQDTSTHQIWNSYLKEYRRYAPETKRDGRTDRQTDIVITIKTKSEVKVKVTATRKWYATLCHPKMHPHTKFWNPTLKNVGYAPDTKRDGRTDSAITICLPKFLWGHKNICRIRIIITQPSIYGVIVFFYYVMSHWTIAQSIFLTIDWNYTMAWFPASLLKTHRRLSTCATTMHIRFVYERRRCATKVKMSHALAFLNSNNFFKLQ